MARWWTKLLIVIAVLGVLAILIVAFPLGRFPTQTYYKLKQPSPSTITRWWDDDELYGPLLLRRQIPSSIDKILQTLDLGNIAFNSPVTLRRDHPSVIHLILSATESVEKLKDLITAAGEREGSRIHISDQMEARLTGMGFKIEAITPQIQGVSKTNVTEWKWVIEPTKQGTQSLHLTLSALLDVQGRQIPRVIRTFERTIDVYVEWPQKVWDFASNNWQWLWTAILIPIGGWILRKRKKRDMFDVC